RALADSRLYTTQAFGCLGPAVGAEVVTFPRRFEDGWRIDAEALRRAVTPTTDLIVLTDLHNPSSARLHDEDLDLVLDLARDADALVLVDEVYLDLDPLCRPTAAHRDPRILVTSSLTKAHGLGDLRAGWILGDPALIDTADRWDDLLCSALPLVALAQATAWFPHADRQLEGVRARCKALTARVDAWVTSRDDVTWLAPPGGFTGFLRLGSPDRPLDGDLVAARAWDDAGVRVVPGSFFGPRSWIRVSYHLPDDDLDEALEGLGRVLDALR
ncbi:MAG: pyridoxal phosphate-dependent aminotransferase, partial [Planctomycetota bacterium]